MPRDNDTLQVPSFSRSTTKTKATKIGGFELWGSSTEVSSNASPDSTSKMPSRKPSFSYTDGNQAVSNKEGETSKHASGNSSVAASDSSSHVSGKDSFTSVTSEHQLSYAFQPRKLQARLADLETTSGNSVDGNSAGSESSSNGDETR
jgi:hypothetical protein